MSNVYADCIAQQAKEGIVRGDIPDKDPDEDEGEGNASNAPAIAKAEFRHSLDEV